MGSKTTDHSAQIINLFQKIAADANDVNRYGVHKEALPYIQDAVKMITTIYNLWVHLALTYYAELTLVSKYNKSLAKDQSLGFIIKDPDARPIEFGGLIVGYQGKKFELFTLYDIVGWIFSVLGKVPVGATRENYYYPLMMIARVFSAKLISNKKAPDVWMVMWFKQKVGGKEVMRVVLGATLDAPSQIVKERTKDIRKDALKKAQVLFWRDGTLPPMQEQEPSGAIVGQDFGHCAESYPFLFICSWASYYSEEP